MKYKFKAKDIKTGKIVTGDLAYVYQLRSSKEPKPYIVCHYANGGNIYLTARFMVDENTIELIKEK